MDKRELKKLRRAELLELLLMQSREIDRLRKELDNANQRLADRQIQCMEAGSIAEAAISVNGVFADAQLAADQYLQNAMALEAETKRRCREMTEQARREAESHWEAVSGRFRDFYIAHPEMRQYLSGEEEEQIMGAAHEKT